MLVKFEEKGEDVLLFPSISRYVFLNNPRNAGSLSIVSGGILDSGEKCGEHRHHKWGFVSTLKYLYYIASKFKGTSNEFIGLFKFDVNTCKETAIDINNVIGRNTIVKITPDDKNILTDNNGRIRIFDENQKMIYSHNNTELVYTTNNTEGVIDIN